ncbi:MAG: hypothetical protein H6Q03_2657 [Acidobacteria bacterium]|nr:hypothetical protein [Acidobacteriota bacterium]
MRASVVYLCDWLPPDFGAVGQYALRAARELARQGREVLLVGLSTAGDSEVEERVGAGRLVVRRLAADGYDRADLARRAAWTLAADLRLVAAALPELARAGEVVFTGSPPFLIHLLVPANLVLRRRLAYRITDFHPECLIAELGRAPGWLRLLRRWTIFLRRFVHRFEVLGEDQRRRLLEIGIPPARIELARDDSPVEIPAGLAPLPRPLALAGRRLLLYSGNFGVAHDDATFVEGYRLHHARGSGGVALWLNATGARADRVEARLRELGLPVHRSQPVPLADLARLLVAPDAHLITLRDEFAGYVLPSKVYGCIRSGRPVLFVGPETSDVHLLCRERLPAGRYLRAAVGDPAAVAAALEAIAALPA